MSGAFVVHILANIHKTEWNLCGIFIYTYISQYTIITSSGTDKQPLERMVQVMERRTFYVIFNFGSVATVGVTIKDGESINDAIKRRSQDID